MDQTPPHVARPAALVLQELREGVAAAEQWVAEIAPRIALGDAADDALDRLADRLADLGRRAAELGELPLADRAALARLRDQLLAVAAEGDRWLAQAGPDLEAHTRRERLGRAYGLVPRGP